uniref:Uncharacterized protein n=1 Tax=Cyclopterus lumpus TaxID=8103 RepID=A0A8C3B178_CYCLU
MDNWKIHFVVVTFCALVQTYEALSSTGEEERRLSQDWPDESMEASLTHPMASLMKRSKALRFYGLMGKRSGSLTLQQKTCLKRNKGEAFVGLMGRSISSGGKAQTPTDVSNSFQNIKAALLILKNTKLQIHI